MVLGEGSRSLADNEIHYIPCAPINRGCTEILEKLISETSDAADKYSSHSYDLVDSWAMLADGTAESIVGK